MELAAQRQDVGFAVTTFPISERRACELLGVWRSSCRYKAKPDHDSELRTQLMELAGERPRFGYRRLGVLLARNGQIVNHKRLFRVYHGAGLSVKRIRRKKLVRVGVPQPVLAQPNEEWSLDFVCYAVADGRSISVGDRIEIPRIGKRQGGSVRPRSQPEGTLWRVRADLLKGSCGDIDSPELSLIRVPKPATT